LMRLIPFLGYHHVLMMFLAIAILILSILLAGCTSHTLTNVYLLSISYLNASTSSADPAQVNSNISNTFSNLTGAGTANNNFLEVRAGYMGICISHDAGKWLCSSGATTLANSLRTHTTSTSFPNSSGDPLNLIWIAGNSGTK